MKSIYLLIIITVILIAAIFGVLSWQKKSINKENNQIKPVIINEYANSAATVSYLIQGEINSNEEHKAIRITVSKDIRTLEVLGGYQYIPINTRSYKNTNEAYAPFLASLQVAGFSKEKSNPKITDPEGRCPLGNKYFFSSTGIPNIPNNLWSSNCGSMGTFGGNLSTVQQLFQNQIPDYTKLTSGVVL